MRNTFDWKWIAGLAVGALFAIAPTGNADAQTTAGTPYNGSPQVAQAATAFPGPSQFGAQPVGPARTYSPDEIVDTGHMFFGQLSGNLASLIEQIFSSYGEPDGYILGQEGSGALFGGLRYGEGTLYTRGLGTHKVYWQGPSIGWDIGGDGARTMMLVYDLPNLASLYQRFTGVNGSAYLVGGFGVTAMAAEETYVVPVRSGVGARLGISLGYLKFTSQPTWNPF